MTTEENRRLVERYFADCVNRVNGPDRAAALALVVHLGLQGLFFYWFLVTTRMVLGVNWGLSVALLAVNWLPSLFLSLLVARYVGVVTVTAG